ncbi:hypothetical protein DFH08DRAFT_937555 [Mycena albidolilacea]|uniref:Uncharacterized protein n=1 Tax=Mycena albidolilacea TaxID=1033008 RepID=A0AAD6ZZ21_9AGAR|nr:hypothetical protein DFH08DRAFT_937555 [Mycena albidolilacea]
MGNEGLDLSQVLRKVTTEGHSPLRDSAHLERGCARWFEAASHAPRHRWAQPCPADHGQTLPRRLNRSRLRLAKAGLTWLQKPSKCSRPLFDKLLIKVLLPSIGRAINAGIGLVRTSNMLVFWVGRTSEEGLGGGVGGGGEDDVALTAFRPFLGTCCVRGASAQLGGPKLLRRLYDMILERYTLLLAANRPLAAAINCRDLGAKGRYSTVMTWTALTTASPVNINLRYPSARFAGALGMYGVQVGHDQQARCRSAEIITADSVVMPRLSTPHGGAARQAALRKGLNAVAGGAASRRRTRGLRAGHRIPSGQG